MSNETAFLAAIRANPSDDATRLVYADWLDERGRPGGAFLRAECALAALEPANPRRAELQAQLREAGAGIDPRWVATVIRAAIENCPAECESRCPKRWERLSPLRSEATRGCDRCGQEVVFCCSLGMAQTRTALGYLVALDPRLARTPRDLESNPDDVARLVHTAAYDTSLEQFDPFESLRYDYLNADEAIRTLGTIFGQRGFTEADAALIRMHAPDAPVKGADILRDLIPWTLPLIEALLDDPLPRARQVAASALAFNVTVDYTVRKALGEAEWRIPGLQSRLLRALDDEHPDVRTAAVLAIHHQDWKSNQLAGVYEALVRRLAVETDAGVRLEIVKDLEWKMSYRRESPLDLEPARASLLADLNNGDWAIRRVVGELLNSAHLSGPDVVTAMLDRLDDPDIRFRLQASKYLEREGVVSVMPKVATALLDGLDDRAMGARVETATFLERFGDASALPKLRAALNDPDNEWPSGDRKTITHYIQDAIAAIESRCEPSDQSKAPGKKKRKRGK